MEGISRIGMDTSKRVFQLHGVDGAERPTPRKRLEREIYFRGRKKVVAVVFRIGDNTFVMTTTPSFAPLAGRLAAKAAEIRPAEGAKASWANFMALFWCAILEMLILLCEALDARAAAEAAAPASRNVNAVSVPAPRIGCQAPSGERRAPRLALAPEVLATEPTSDDAPAGTVGYSAPAGPRLVWSRDPGPIRGVHAPPWRRRRETRAFAPGIRHANFVSRS